MSLRTPAQDPHTNLACRPDKDSLKGISKMIQGEVEKAKQSVRRLRKGAMDDCKALTSKDDKRRQEKQVSNSYSSPLRS